MKEAKEIKLTIIECKALELEKAMAQFCPRDPRLLKAFSNFQSELKRAKDENL